MPEANRILIVDDDPDVHQLLNLALRDSGRHFESAFDGLEGLRKLEAARWDLVITDVIMPGIPEHYLSPRTNVSTPRTNVPPPERTLPSRDREGAVATKAESTAASPMACRGMLLYRALAYAANLAQGREFPLAS